MENLQELASAAPAHVRLTPLRLSPKWTPTSATQECAYMPLNHSKAPSASLSRSSVSSPSAVPISSTPDYGEEYSDPTSLESPVVMTPSQLCFTQVLDEKLASVLHARKDHWVKTEPSEEAHRNQMFERPPNDDKYTNSGSSSDCDTNPFSPYNADSERSIGHDAASRNISGSPPARISSASPLKRRRAHSSGCKKDKEAVDEAPTEVDSDSQTPSSRSLPGLDQWQPDSKRLKLTAKGTSFVYTATETATSRLAKSLTSSASSSFDSSDRVVLTVLAAPAHKPGFDLIPTLPIIAPPEYALIPQAPMTNDDIAEARLKTMMSKEKRRRFKDGVCEALTEGNDFKFGMDSKFWREVIQWMFAVVPSKKMRCRHLRAHLLHGNETRFHAVMIFSRYFLMVGDGMPTANKKETRLMRLGRERITWDVAVSCLALAVKFHQDFLMPLSPIHSRDFLALAPHLMSHDDFEISQKDVLEALEYEIRGVTPQPFIEEIWLCLSTLRKLLDFEDGWKIAQEHAWLCLRKIALDADVLRFPVSVLTSVAVVEGVVESLITKYERDLGVPCQDVAPEVEDHHTERAHRAVQELIEDLKDLLQISQDDLRACRRWLCKSPASGAVQ